jgi:aromatic-L-amino-acid decarboxylase
MSCPLYNKQLLSEYPPLAQKNILALSYYKQEAIMKHNYLNLDGDLEAKRKLAHQMIDDVFDFYGNINEEPVWKPLSKANKAFLDQKLPQEPQAIEDIYAEFKEHIFPFHKGNFHPRFWAWVQGAGTPTCSLADMLASFMNPNTTIGEHAAMYVDEQVIKWSLEIMDSPKTGHGLLTSGGSMANITGLLVARNNKVESVREKGIQDSAQQLTFYCSTETHSCVQKAIEIMGK